MSSRNGTAFPADRASGVSATPTLDAHQQSALALDAYSQTVIAVADALSPSVANLQVQRRTRRGPATGAGSGVPCIQGFEVAELDPAAWKAKTVFDSQGKGNIIPGVSVALQVGNSIYVGAFQGDRLVRIDWKQ